MKSIGNGPDYQAIIHVKGITNMHDIISAHLISQEIDRKALELRYEMEDPDSLYRYEIWDSIGARPSLAERLRSLISRFRRPGATSKPVPAASGEVPVSTTQCAPQC